jgi:hypothetical protein
MVAQFKPALRGPQVMRIRWLKRLHRLDSKSKMARSQAERKGEFGRLALMPNNMELMLQPVELHARKAASV